jgi:hypothetical protein
VGIFGPSSDPESPRTFDSGVTLAIIHSADPEVRSVIADTIKKKRQRGWFDAGCKIDIRLLWAQSLRNFRSTLRDRFVVSFGLC